MRAYDEVPVEYWKKAGNISCSRRQLHDRFYFIIDSRCVKLDDLNYSVLTFFFNA